MSQLRAPLTAGAIDEYANHIMTRIDAGDDATALEASLRSYDSAVSGDVVKQRLKQIIDVIVQTRPLSAGQVGAVMTGSGSGYTKGDMIPITGDGAGAAIFVGNVADGDEVETVAITGGGTGYVVGDVIVVTGDGTGATAVVSGETAGVIDTILITDGGTGYTSAAIDASGSGNGDATATASLTTAGEIQGYSVAAGDGYVLTANADTAGVGGADATFTTTISNDGDVLTTVAEAIAAA